MLSEVSTTNVTDLSLVGNNLVFPPCDDVDVSVKYRCYVFKICYRSHVRGEHVTNAEVSS